MALFIVLGSISLAFITFVWPLLGIHGVLETEKARLHLDARERMRDALQEMKSRQDKGDTKALGQ